MNNYYLSYELNLLGSHGLHIAHATTRECSVYRLLDSELASSIIVIAQRLKNVINVTPNRRLHCAVAIQTETVTEFRHQDIIIVEHTNCCYVTVTHEHGLYVGYSAAGV